VQPSSLVFLVIIGVWAAYFVQYWVRRREHLATVHAVDQFSESMRVLERQSAEGVVEGAPRASSPQTLLKRTATASAEVEHDSAPVAPAVPASATARRGGARRKRGLAVLTSFVALLISVPLAVLGFAPLAVVAVPAVALVAAVAWVRRGAAAERAARRATQRAVRPRPQRRPEAAVAPATPAAAAPAVPVAEAGLEAQRELEAEVAPQVRDELYDVLEVERAYAPAVVEAAQPEYLRPLVDDDDIPLTWDPVPVPRPTYAMKSRVTRPAPTAADLVGDADTEYADLAHAAYEDEEPTRRVAGA
jgi:hypothetical protein